MDFELPEELRILKATLRRFVDNELIPIERETTDGEKLKPQYLERFERRAKELGIWQLDVPTDYGGGGMSTLARAVVWEELSRTIAIPARGEGITGPSVRGILYSLQGEMKEKYLLPLLRGEKKACFAQTEPDAGSDPGSMRTTAVREGDHYLINGVKRFITGAGDADFMQPMVATDRTKGSRGGISCFIVDMDAPGVKLGTCYETMRFGQQWLNIGRVKHGARALGVAERCIEMAASYAKQRSTFGRPLAERQAVQWMLADMFIELQAARLLVYQTATRLDQGEEAREHAYVAKYFADEMAFKAADQCMQIHGGIALTTDLPIEKMWRQQRSYRITEGASEVMKMVIARHVLKAYG